MAQEPVGFIGLGNMGAPIASNLLRAGHAVKVWNRTASKAVPLAAAGAMVVRELHEAATPGGIVFSILSDDRALESIVTEAFLAALSPGGIHVSMSTILPANATTLAERHAHVGVTYLAAPVFGRPDAAAAGKLWICTSGDGAAKMRVAPLLPTIGQGIFDFGPDPAAAHIVKVAGNFMIMSAIEGMSEASALVEKCGVRREAFLKMLLATLFNCPIYQNYGKKLIEASFGTVGFAMPLALKDITLALQSGLDARAPLPLANLVRDRYLAMIATGRGHLDASAFALKAAEDAGLNWLGSTSGAHI
jgi:3-hydroxyisobutyrate dehydrogenase-like beta-hydroxyacid dehydrogenase